jgi:uncharacterized secreted protein with C-terminal beta-propeller domain
MIIHDEHDFDCLLERTLATASRWEGSPQAMFHRVRAKLKPQPWYRRFKPVTALGAAALSLLLALGIYYYSSGLFVPAAPTDSTPLPPSPRPPVIAAVELPVVGTEEKLWELAGTNQLKIPAVGIIRGRVVLDSGQSGLQFNKTAVESAGHSTTNIQVQGVDEGDIIKTDGKYLYQARAGEITVSRIYPDNRMQVLSRIKLPDNCYARELYLDKQLLTVIAVGEGGYGKRLWYFSANTRLLVYDITDNELPALVREVEVDGHLLSSRKVGPVVYLVAQKYLYEYLDDEKPSVFFRDKIKDEEKEIGLGAIRYFPGIQHEAFLTVLALDVSDGKKEATVDVYLGSGRNIFMSRNNLYVAFEKWSGPGEDEEVKTLVHRFYADGTEVIHQGMGEVPGSILNQFSMDEYDGYFRIATTSYREEMSMSGNVYILDYNMQIVGRLEGLAPGERIYSARFMGEKGYLVTFELIDPLFVIDLADPANPRVLGELKIPGFSNYLHPLDDTTLLGIGRDTEVIYTRGGPAVQQKGIKLAVFDVSEVNNPKELHVEIIGDERSYSEALFDHKAVLFYNGVLALPVYLAGNTPGNLPDKSTWFQGALVYRVTKKNGFTTVGRVSHQSITRSLIINNVFYTVSDNYIRANRLAPGLFDLGTLTLPVK